MNIHALQKPEDQWMNESNDNAKLKKHMLTQEETLSWKDIKILYLE